MTNIIFEIGIDIEEIERFRKNQFEESKLFYIKLFTQREIDYCLTKKDPYPHFTARYCAKEAVKKTFNNIGFVGWKEIEILNKESGQPEVVVKSKNSKTQEIIDTIEIKVTLSHEKNKAIAFVITKSK